MAARALPVDTAMVNDDYRRRELLPKPIRSLDVRAHILIAAFAACNRTIQRVDHDCGAVLGPDLGPNVADQFVNVGYKIEPRCQEIKGRVGVLADLRLPERLAAGAKATLSLARHIANRTGLNAAPAVFPLERETQHQVENPKALAAFRRPP